jgi:hypothetical protein
MTLTVFAALAAVLAQTPASTGTAVQPRRSTPAEEAQQRELARASVQQPQPEAALVLPQPQFTLVGERGKQTVSGTLGVAVDDLNIDATFSGPISETADEASPLTLGGLQNGTSLRVGVSHGVITKRRLSAEDVDKISSFCEARGTPDDCDTTDMEPWERARFIRLFMPTLPVFWGAHLTLTRTKFTYSVDEGLTDQSQSYTNQGGTFSLGVLTPNLWFLAAHIEAQKFRKPAGSAVEVCAPLGTSGAMRCRTTRLGAPTDPISTTLLTLEGRRIFVGRNIGVNPRFSADLEEGTKVFEVPIYFLREQLDASKNPIPSLNGGVSVGWHSENGAEIRAFVGVAFKLVSLR